MKKNSCIKKLIFFFELTILNLKCTLKLSQKHKMVDSEVNYFDNIIYKLLIN